MVTEPVNRRVVVRLLNFLIRFRRIATIAADLVVFTAAGIGAFLLRFDFALPADCYIHIVYGLAIWIPTKLVVFRIEGLEPGGDRLVSAHGILQIATTNLIASTVGAVLIFLLAPAGFPRSVCLIDFLLCSLATGAVRVLVRIASESALRDSKRRRGPNTLVYGAGAAGDILACELRADSRLPNRIVGFVDDNPNKRGERLQGIPVLGTGRDLESIIRKHAVEQVLIAVPSATGTQMTEILRRCQQAGVKCKTVPALADILESGLAGLVRDVRVEDLLGRKPVRLEVAQISDRLQGRVVLVSGGAGSIGGELCRQVARFSPRALIAYDVAETPLFYLEREIRTSFPAVPFYPEIGNVQDAGRLSEVLESHAPAVIFHAAAYKHVPMMESHVFQAVQNNVFGTRTIAAAAGQFGVQDFVMISTDKAVRPTSVMGATKRLAELVVNSMQNGTTKYCSVRFGNVLGSNGSVIPVFKEQIRAGGPVTVTHPDMRRFFMTIPEAAQLVLQAATIGSGGEVFVLDMGSPVRIVDLATNLILLSGLKPDEDVKIVFTGIRPGEKLYEEVSAMEESTLPTSHEKIRIFSGPSLDSDSIRLSLAELEKICAERDMRRLVLLFKEIVPEYNPSAELLTVAFGATRVESYAHKNPPYAVPREAPEQGCGPAYSRHYA